MITLKTLETASEKEVFEQVKTHLLTQGAQSLRDGEIGKCAYRGMNGMKCAAGCLIADDEYDPSIEGLSWDYLTRKFIVPDNHRVLISDLQTIHDYEIPHEWEDQLSKLAIKRGL